MDIFDKCQLPQVKLAKEQGFYPYFQTISQKKGPMVEINGRTYIMAGSNDYLGLSSDPRLIDASSRAVRKFGTTCSGSRLLNGTLSLHEELEERLACFLNKEKALVVTTGYTANLTVLSALIGREDIVVADRLNHASLNDGMRLSFGTFQRYRHKDYKDCASILSGVNSNGNVLVASDGVFSMEGDMADLAMLASIKQSYGVRMLVDDAHGIGVIGTQGRGTAEHFGVEKDVDILIGTFSKAFGSLGGFIAGPAQVIEYIQHTATPFIYSASMTPAALSAALQALTIIENEPERRIRLRKYALTMREELIRIGFGVYEGISPIIAIKTGNDEKTFHFWKQLMERGIFVNPVISPAVPHGKQLIRMFLMATLSEENIERILYACQSAGKQSELI